MIERIQANTDASGEYFLNPKLTRQVMEKVCDVNMPEKAYSVLTRQESLSSVLTLGLLGAKLDSPHRGINSKTIEDMKVDYIKTIKERVQVGVWFNIVGRSMNDFDEQVSPMREGVYFALMKSSIAIIFDLSPFKEMPIYDIDAAEKSLSDNIRLPLYSFVPVLDHSSWDYGNDGKIHTETHRGFKLFPRIPPRLFQGIIFTENPSEKKLISVVQTMLNVYKDKSELLIPIYGEYGDLLWPKGTVTKPVGKIITSPCNNSMK